MKYTKLVITNQNHDYGLTIAINPSVLLTNDEPVQIKHIEAAFINIYTLLGSKKLSEVVVPYQNDMPICWHGDFSSRVKMKMNHDYLLLEAFINKKTKFKDLPIVYQSAFIKGQNERFIAKKILNAQHPNFSRMVSIWMGAIAGYATFHLAAFMGFAFGPGAWLAWIGISLLNHYVLQNWFWGTAVLGYSIIDDKHILIMPDSISFQYGIYFPYRPTIDKLENIISELLVNKKKIVNLESIHEIAKFYADEIFNHANINDKLVDKLGLSKPFHHHYPDVATLEEKIKEKLLSPTAVSQNVKLFTPYYVRKVVNQYPEYFYPSDTETANSHNYIVKKATSK